MKRYATPLLTMLLAAHCEKEHVHSHVPGAHVHGRAEIQIAVEKIDGIAYFIRFEAPAKDLLGFERDPVNDDERKKKTDLLSSLKEGSGLVSGKDCTTEFVASEEEKEGEHRSIVAQYRLSCSKPLSSIQIRFLTAFPSIKDAAVTIVGENGQSIKPLAPDQTTLELPE
ncbi:MAG: hypothetical protein CVV45_07095 [Spirochaetae bacterium HGW-Spirochaetae-10]|nr:MAG: hypothetical protein CVV45_07095 [Spirochaetae bacterium HGW-Spirochaetae-10]